VILVKKNIIKIV